MFYSQPGPWEDVQHLPAYDLKNLHTKVLMRYRAMCYKFNGKYDPTDNNGPCIPVKAILDELNTRPHVANKKEARELRQKKAKK